MKCLAALVVALTMALTLAACSGNRTTPGSETGNTGSQPPAPGSPAPESSTAPASSGAPEQSTGSAPEAEAPGSQPESEPEPPAESEGKKVLVAYFSATNTTKGVAEKIAAGTGGDLYRITPAEPYTSADLNYGDNGSRSSIEMNDPSARPAISGPEADMAQYDVVFLGYPIWWGEAPRIINTFLESCDFSGKTIVPFCTSGSSGIGSSAENLQGSTAGAAWLSGQRMSSSVSQSEIDQWIDGLGLELSAGESKQSAQK